MDLQGLMEMAAGYREQDQATKDRRNKGTLANVLRAHKGVPDKRWRIGSSRDIGPGVRGASRRGRTSGRGLAEGRDTGYLKGQPGEFDSNVLQEEERRVNSPVRNAIQEQAGMETERQRRDMEDDTLQRISGLSDAVQPENLARESKTAEDSFKTQQDSFKKRQIADQMQMIQLAAEDASVGSEALSKFYGKDIKVEFDGDKMYAIDQSGDKEKVLFVVSRKAVRKAKPAPKPMKIGETWDLDKDGHPLGEKPREVFGIPDNQGQYSPINLGASPGAPPPGGDPLKALLEAQRKAGGKQEKAKPENGLPQVPRAGKPAVSRKAAPQGLAEPAKVASKAAEQNQRDLEAIKDALLPTISAEAGDAIGSTADAAGNTLKYLWDFYERNHTGRT